MSRLHLGHKVFGIGLSRTGTTSLAKALNALAIPTIHYPCDPITYNELRSGIYRLSILERYRGATDIPVAPYYRQFDVVYPGSKFILTVREISSWLISVENHWHRWCERDVQNEFNDFIHASVYGALRFNADRFRHVYNSHIYNVRRYFCSRPDDLLIFNVFESDGWPKLCSFLDLPVPRTPFPCVNSGQENDIWVRYLNVIAQDISCLVPPRRPVILVDDETLRQTIVTDRQTIPFLERDGYYYGRPADSETAIREFERLRRDGASYIVFAWPCFWWLEYYAGFYKYLVSKYPCTMKNDRIIAFDLVTKLG
jgi:hypothetical protein